MGLYRVDHRRDLATYRVIRDPYTCIHVCTLYIYMYIYVYIYIYM